MDVTNRSIITIHVQDKKIYHIFQINIIKRKLYFVPFFSSFYQVRCELRDQVDHFISISILNILEKTEQRNKEDFRLKTATDCFHEKKNQVIEIVISGLFRKKTVFNILICDLFDYGCLSVR